MLNPSPDNTWPRGPRRPSGFTMIEILVTLVILSIGLLGLAGLQIGGLRANMGSEQQSKATLMADDIIERMRANPLGVEANGYAAIDSANLDCGRLPSPFCSNYNDGSEHAAENCTPTEMATFDAWVWACGMPVSSQTLPGGVVNRLSGGAATIQCVDADPADGDPCSPGSQHIVSVSWQSRAPSEGEVADVDNGGTIAVDAGDQVTRNVTVSVIP